MYLLYLPSSCFSLYFYGVFQNGLFLYLGALNDQSKPGTFFIDTQVEGVIIHDWSKASPLFLSTALDSLGARIPLHFA